MNIIKPGRFGYPLTDKRRPEFDTDNQKLIDLNKPIDFILIGDSITEYLPMQKIRKNARVVNRGIAGDRTMYMLKRFEADVLQLKPQNVMIHGGINDIQAWLRNDIRYENMNEEEIIFEVVQNIENMATLAFNNNIGVYLSTILPIKKDIEKKIDNEKANKIIVQINQKIAKSAYDNHYNFINYYSEFLDISGNLREELTHDGLHPNEYGYNIMLGKMNIIFRDVVGLCEKDEVLQ